MRAAASGLNIPDPTQRLTLLITQHISLLLTPQVNQALQVTPLQVLVLTTKEQLQRPNILLLKEPPMQALDTLHLHTLLQDQLRIPQHLLPVQELKIFSMHFLIGREDSNYFLMGYLHSMQLQLDWPTHCFTVWSQLQHQHLF